VAKSRPVSVDEKKWQVESDLNALKQAEEIRTDRKRLAAVQKLAKQQQSALNRINPQVQQGTKKGRKK
jgi:hypothetical protein